MDSPDPPKPPAAPAPKPATPRVDEGVRWLSRPQRAPVPGASAPPTQTAPAPTQAVPGAEDLARMAPEVLSPQMGGGRWGAYAGIAGVVLVVSSIAIAALLFAARAPGNAESASRSLSAMATPGPKPSGAPSASASAVPTVSQFPVPAEVPTPSATDVQSSSNNPSTSTTASATTAPSATPAASTTPAASASAARATGDGTISTPPSAGGHRVFVDDRYAGDSPGPIKVRCGHHLVKVGSGGTAHPIDVPCGGDVVVPVR